MAKLTVEFRQSPGAPQSQLLYLNFKVNFQALYLLMTFKIAKPLPLVPGWHPQTTSSPTSEQHRGANAKGGQEMVHLGLKLEVRSPCLK